MTPQALASGRLRRRLALATTIATAIALSCAAMMPASTATAAPGDGTPATDTNINGYRAVGYYPQWVATATGLLPKHLIDNGAAENITHINYAFGNIHPTELTCFMSDGPGGAGEAPDEGDGAGDALADYGREMTAAESVSGVADSPDQALAGNFNQLRMLKQQYPDTKILVSLGGWTWSKFFSPAVASEASRAKLVSSCIDLYIKGDLPVLNDHGGVGAGAGIFDGIDIDWEWPGAPEWGQHPGNITSHPDSEIDRENLRLTLAEFRKQMDALTAETGNDYLLTAFLPADPAKLDQGWDAPAIFDSLDFGNIQGYDLAGPWDKTTGVHTRLFDDPAITAPQFSVDRSVQAYLAKGVDPQKLGIGMAMYGLGWSGVADGGTNGLNQVGTGQWWGPGPDGSARYKDIKNFGTTYQDDVFVGAWAYDGDQFWGMDNPATTQRKAEYIHDLGLGGGMWWDLSGDDGSELSGTLATAFRSLPAGPVFSPEVAPAPPPVVPTVTPTVTPTVPVAALAVSGSMTLPILALALAVLALGAGAIWMARRNRSK